MELETIGIAGIKKKGKKKSNQVFSFKKSMEKLLSLMPLEKILLHAVSDYLA